MVIKSRLGRDQLDFQTRITQIYTQIKTNFKLFVQHHFVILNATKWSEESQKSTEIFPSSE